MQLLDLTLPTAAENVALDEALLEQAEMGAAAGEWLRLWEPNQPQVVIGRSSRIEREVDRLACRRDKVPVIRRTSGGLAIVSGRGCLMYGVVLDMRIRPELRSIDQAHCFVLRRILDAVRSLGPDAVCQGHSDLTLNDRKFSGNSLRMRRDFLLYHGTLLYDFDLTLITRYLKQPDRQPDYRRLRTHDQFVANLPVDGPSLRQAIAAAWEVTGTVDTWPEPVVRRLVEERFKRDEWNAKR